MRSSAMKTITLNRITASAWSGSNRVGYLYVDFPTDWSEDVVAVLTDNLIASARREYPGLSIETEHDEIAWSV
jgi:hypothetical protein